MIHPQNPNNYQVIFFCAATHTRSLKFGNGPYKTRTIFKLFEKFVSFQKRDAKCDAYLEFKRKSFSENNLRIHQHHYLLRLPQVRPCRVPARQATNPLAVFPNARDWTVCQTDNQFTMDRFPEATCYSHWQRSPSLWLSMMYYSISS